MSAVSEALLSVRVQPRARREEIVGLREGVLVVRVRAPALEGRANLALCRLLAGRLDIAPSRVSVVRGERAREKVVRIAGLDPADVQELLSRS
jgi:uncharacterized protein (TIGR00251 family)